MVLSNFNQSIVRSVVAHLALFFALVVWIIFSPKVPLFSSAPITIEVIESTAQNIPLNEDKSKTVVQRSEGQKAETAKRDAYLSDETRVIDEETSARRAGELSPSTKPQGAEYRSQTKLPRLSELGIKVDKSKPKESFENERKWAEHSTGERIRGGQYIRGMKEGEVTALNTKEFVFYSYFERVRRQLDSAWQPLLRSQIERIYKHGRRLASDSDYVTRTLVTLDNRGQVKKVQLLEESGTVDLDQAAVDALNRAGPYPNPPSGLIGSDGSVQIRWDFILKT